MSDVLSYQVENAIAQVTFNRPDKMNALNMALFEALTEVGETIKADNSIRAVVLTGAGKSFCGGLDMSLFTGGADWSRLEERTHGLTNIYQQVSWVWHEIPVPVIAAIHGHCLGGGLQIASGADMRFVHPEAKLSIMEIKWGLVPDMAGTQLWSRYVREDILRDLTYTGRIFSGGEAMSFGFATRLCDDPLAEALQAAEQIAGKNPHAIRAGKRLINSQSQVSYAEGLLAEAIEQKAILGSPNQMEAVMANMEKRAPNFADPEA